MEIIRTQPINRSAQGVQSFVGKCTYDGKSVIYKYSRHIDYIIDLEYDTWSMLNSLDLPHFCEIFGKEVVSKQHKTCIFMKYIPHDSLSQFILDEKCHPKAMLTSVYQVLIAIAIYTEKHNITHYDLHSDNVMMDHTDHDVHVYLFGDGETFAYETFGWCPVIIDLGMAYLPNSPLRGTLAFSNCGFTPFCFDALVDARLLLSTAISDLKSRKSKKKRKYKSKSTFGGDLIKSFEKSAKGIFSKVPIQENGWFKDKTFANARNRIVDGLPINQVDMRLSSIFDPFTIEWPLEIILSKIILPLRKKVLPTDTNLRREFTLFFAEWIVVEDMLRNGTKELGFLKDLIDLSPKAMKSKYPRVKNLTELTSHLNLMIGGIEEVLFACQNEINNKKVKLYSKLPVKTTRDVIRKLPTIPIKYTTNQKIKVFNVDDPSKSAEFKLTFDQATRLNDNLITWKDLLDSE